MQDVIAIVLSVVIWFSIMYIVLWSWDEWNE